LSHDATVPKFMPIPARHPTARQNAREFCAINAAIATGHDPLTVPVTEYAHHSPATAKKNHNGCIFAPTRNEW
jgi:hypothetical protein